MTLLLFRFCSLPFLFLFQTHCQISVFPSHTHRNNIANVQILMYPYKDLKLPKQRLITLYTSADRFREQKDTGRYYAVDVCFRNHCSVFS